MPRDNEAFMTQIADRVGGQLDNVYHTEFAVTVFASDAGFDGLHVTFSPSDQPDGFWIANVTDETGDFSDDLSAFSRIPNDSQDVERIVAWIKGFKAGLV